MLFIKYSILIMACAGALIGIIIGLKSLPGFLRKCRENNFNGFRLLAFVFSPLSQAVHSLILWIIISSNIEKNGQDQAVDSKIIIAGLAIGLVFMLVAVAKAFIGKRACRVFSETGKAFNKYMIISGFVETISIFALIFGFITFKL